MSVNLVECDAVKPDGTVCGKPAIVHKSHHEYHTQLYGNLSGQITHKLLASHYEIECTDCRLRSMTTRESRP